MSFVPEYVFNMLGCLTLVSLTSFFPILKLFLATLVCFFIAYSGRCWWCLCLIAHST